MISRMKSGGAEYIKTPGTVSVVMDYNGSMNHPVPVAVFTEQTIAQEYIRRSPMTSLRVVNTPFEPNYKELSNPGSYWEVRFDDDGGLIPTPGAYLSTSPYPAPYEQYAKRVDKPSTTPIHYRILEKGFGPVSANKGELIMTVRAKDAEDAVRIARRKRSDYIDLTRSMNGP